MFKNRYIFSIIIIMLFLCILFIPIFLTSYYLKISNQRYEEEISLYKNNNTKHINQIILSKEKLFEIEKEKFKKFSIISTLVVIFFLLFFLYLMQYIIKEIIKKYKNKVKKKEQKLKILNENLFFEVQKAIQEVKKKDNKLLEQEKLARIGSMINMIAHQWRQPLTQLSVILMELETSIRFKKVNKDYLLEAIYKSDKVIEFMSNTIDDFRNFYKLDKKKEYFSITQLCKKAINIIDATLNNFKINLEFDFKEDKQLFGYPNEFSQVILNIIINAKDILIERQISNPKINIKTIFENNIFCILIEDNAGGINKEHLEYIFEPYYTTKELTNGTGLGLYIAKIIIEKNMHGELSVINNYQGAIFKIAFKDKNE